MGLLRRIRQIEKELEEARQPLVIIAGPGIDVRPHPGGRAWMVSVNLEQLRAALAAGDGTAGAEGAPDGREGGAVTAQDGGP